MDTPRPIKIRLCLMMFLQYFVQGSYLNIVSVYLSDALGFSPEQIGNISAALGIGPLLAPFIIGQLVDRLLPTERVLAGCHLLAGATMIALYLQTAYLPVLLLVTVYSVLYIPTMMLTNTLAFRHLTDRDREFPLVRVWGTIGFIVPAWLIEFYFLNGLTGEALNRGRGIAFLTSGVVGLCMAAYCLTLPSTPPAPAASGRYAPGAVFALLRRRDFLVLTIVTFLVAGVHTFYFVWNSPLVKVVLSRVDAADKVQSFTTIAQIAEIAAMALVGPSITRLGFKPTMALGLLAYALRCVVLAAAGSTAIAPATAIALAATGNALHGICFGFFLATAFMYVNKVSPADVRGSMQTIYGTLIFGLGGVLGAKFAGNLGEAYRIASPSPDWSGLWLVCGAVAAVCAVAFALGFPRRPAADDAA